MTESKGQMEEVVEEAQVQEWPQLPDNIGGIGLVEGALGEEEARQIVYSWRVLLTQMGGAQKFGKPVPRAFNAQMFEDGSLLLRPYHIPSGVVLPGELANVEMAPIARSQARTASPMPVEPYDSTLEERSAERRNRAKGTNNGMGGGGTPQRRRLESTDGRVEVVPLTEN